MMRRSKRILALVTAVMLFSAAVPGLGSASTLTLPGMLRDIEASAFESDTSLDEVILPNGVETIGARAFADSSVTRIHLPASLNYIAEDAFDGAESAELSADRGTYAWDWLYGDSEQLAFEDSEGYEVTVDMGIFEDSDEAGVYSDSFVYYYHLADVEEWFYRLDGDPVWTVTQTAGPEMNGWLAQENPYCASLCVEMPETPAESEYEVLCEWGGMQVSSHVTVRYDELNVLPEGTDIPDLIELRLNEENIIPMHFVPENYSFANADRGALLDYTGDGEYWFAWHDLHMFPRTEGTFTGVITLYAGNLYMVKNVVFRVTQGGDGLRPAAEASWTDCYTLSWNAAPEAQRYTVRAFMDEECTWEYRNMETEECFAYFNTDVATRYWFTVEYTGTDGNTVCSEAVSAMPLPVLDGPENVYAEAEEDGTVRLSWDPVEGAYGYRTYFSGSPEWTPDTEWFSQGGETENSELQIGENETMYIWVCADNGDGPHGRTGTLVVRYEDILSVVAEEGMTLPSLMLDYEEYPILSTENVPDGETLAFLNEYNALAGELNADMEEYNAFVQEQIGTIEAFMTGVSGSVDRGFSVGGYQVTAEALTVVSGDYEITDSRIEGDALIISLRSAAGDTASLRITETGISRDEGMRTNRLRAAPAPTAGNDEIGLAGSLAGEACHKLFIEGQGKLIGIRRGNRQIELKISIANQGPVEALKGKARSDILRTCQSNEAKAAARAKGYRVIEKAGKVAGIGDDVAGLVQDITSAGQLRAFMNEHGHPTGLELLHDESFELTQRLSELETEAECWLAADLAVNGISLALSFAKLHPAGAVTIAVATYAANKWLNEKVEAVCSEMTRIDGVLHYEVTGTVRDQDTGETLEDVEVTCDMPPFGPMTVRTDATGIYRLEPLTDSFTLTFRKEKYEDLPVSIPEAGRRVEQNVAYPYHAEMVRSEEHTSELQSRI